MSAELAIRNHQRAVRLDLPFLREITLHLLEAELGLKKYALGVQFVSERRMAQVNLQFLQHEGPTDVITFDHRARATEAMRLLSLHPLSLHGELFICPAVAREQAKTYRTALPEELSRYLIHGVLHLRGFDDLTAAARKVMKREETRLLRRLSRRFTLSKARRAPKVCP